MILFGGLLAWCIALLALRVFRTHKVTYVFLWWNLFLAWIPVVASMLLVRAHRRGTALAIQVALFALWLLFLPNAPYVITDLLHLAPRPPVPLWFDLALLVSCAGTALLFGYVSLVEVQDLVTERFNRLTGWLVVVASMFLSGFGIYLGRFGRWNSWEAFTNPSALFADIAQRVFNPTAHPRTVAVTIIFGTALTLGYVALRLLPMQLRDVRRMTTFLLALLLASCTAMPSHEPAAPRILALGDSYTIGESVAEADRWPNQLARALGAPNPEIIAKTGWTTDELNAAIDAANPQGPYRFVTLLIGVNNQYRGRDVEQYRGEFAALLQRAIGFAGGDAKRVIVVSIPDWGVTPFAEGRDRAKIAAEIDRYNAVNREEASRAGAKYVDITPVSRRADPSLVAGDGLHPSAAQYAEWTKLILPLMKQPRV